MYPSRDTDAVAAAFMTDIHARMPSICGEPVSFSSKALVPFARLSSAGSLRPHPNVRPAAPVKSANSQLLGLRRVPVGSASIARPQMRPADSMYPSSDPTTSSTHCQTLQQSQLVPKSKPLSLKSHAQPNPNSQADSVPTILASQVASVSRTPILPIFKPTRKAVPTARSQSNQNSHSCTPRAPTVPTFKPRVSSKPQNPPQRISTVLGTANAKANPNKPSTQKRVNSSGMPPPAKRPHLTSSSVPTTTATASTVRGTIPSTQQSASSCSSVISQQLVVTPGNGHQVVPDLTDPLAQGSVPLTEDDTNMDFSTGCTGKTTTSAAMLHHKKTAAGEVYNSFNSQLFFCAIRTCIN